MYDIIIVGAGPAGLTAALYGRRGSKKVLVLEAKTYGGQIVNASKIENYPVEANISGFDFATKLYEQVKNIGAEVVFEKVIEIKNNGDIKEVVTDSNTYKTKTVIIATGATNRKLGLDNESKLTGRGVSYCATCDGAFYKNKTVAVVGGGNTALEDTLYLSDIASKVYLIHRRDTFRGDESTINKIKNKNNVEIIYNSTIKKLNAIDNLESIDIIDSENNIKTINISGLFIAIGQTPDNELFDSLIKLDKDGYVIANENCCTDVSGIFVAGDNRQKEIRQLVTATSDGAIAASQSIKYINNKKEE